MDELSVLKAKEEITKNITDYIDKRFENEKALIVSYIGWGARIAGGGLAVAILIVGFFGWKSYDDINKSISAEITARFNKDNPVNKYDQILKEATVRGILDSLNARLTTSRGRPPLERSESVTFLANSLQDPSISLNTKFNIIRTAALISDNSILATIANSARSVLDSLKVDDGRQLASGLIDLYSAADTSKYTSDISTIFDKFPNEPNVILSMARCVFKVNGDRADEIIKRISKNNNKIAQYAKMVGEIRFTKDYTLNKQEFGSIVSDAINAQSFSSDGRVSFFDLISTLKYIGYENKNFWEVVSTFTSVLRDKKITMSMEDEHGEKTALFGQGGGGFLIQLTDVDKISSDVYSAFVERTDSFSNATPDDLSTLSYWMLSSREKAGLNNHISYILYDSANEIHSDSGAIIGRDRIGGRLLIYIDEGNNSPIISIRWRNGAGEIVHETAKRIIGFQKDNLSLKEIPGPSLFDDEL